MATGENVLWIVERTIYNADIKLKTFVFRTRKAATDWIREERKKNDSSRNRHFRCYHGPIRATWGPNE